jgi:hypothetical protein
MNSVPFDRPVLLQIEREQGSVLVLASERFEASWVVTFAGGRANDLLAKLIDESLGGECVVRTAASPAGHRG